MGFRDLQRYPALKARYDKYKEWLDATPVERQKKYAAITDEKRRAKIARIPGYISPFGTVGTTKVYVPARLIAANQTGQGSGVAEVLRKLLETYTIVPDELKNLTGAIVVETPRFKAARLTLKAVVPATEKSDSRITGRQYLKPDVDSVVCSFGQNAGGQDYEVAVLAIKGASEFKTFVEGNGGKNRVKFTPEG